MKKKKGQQKGRNEKCQLLDSTGQCTGHEQRMPTPERRSSHFNCCLRGMAGSACSTPAAPRFRCGCAWQENSSYQTQPSVEQASRPGWWQLDKVLPVDFLVLPCPEELCTARNLAIKECPIRFCTYNLPFRLLENYYFWLRTKLSSPRRRLDSSNSH